MGEVMATQDLPSHPSHPIAPPAEKQGRAASTQGNDNQCNVDGYVNPHISPRFIPFRSISTMQRIVIQMTHKNPQNTKKHRTCDVRESR